MPSRRQEKTGVVISDRMEKTVVVKVVRLVKDRLYKRYITRTSKFHAHDQENNCSLGDKVRIQETRPLSRLKRWRIVEIISKKDSNKELPKS